MMLRVPALPRIPLIEDLTKGPIPPGSNILVEFDPASQWYNTSVTIAAGYLKTGGEVDYYVYTRPVKNVRSQFKELGLDVATLEKEERVILYDAYSATLGQKSTEKVARDSLKVADLSIYFGREVMQSAAAPGRLLIEDNLSVIDRFNEEKSWVELYLTRRIPAASMRKLIAIRGLVSGIHSNKAYKTLESAVDGIICSKLTK